MNKIAAVLLLTVSAMGSELSGTWIGTFSVPGSDHKEPQHFILKQDGKKLTGSGGPDAVEQYPILNGSVENDIVSFELTTGEWTFRYELKAIQEEMNGDLQLRSKHSLREAGDFYVSLVKDNEFQKNVNDIVIEFGSWLSQPILDRYVDGEEVPLSELQQVWRNTTKVFAFESPVYTTFLKAVRDANRGLPPAHRLRVLAGDSPIDWANVTTHKQWESYQPNDVSFAEVINDQVLAHDRKALVIMGGSHQGSIFEILYRRLVLRLGHNKTIGAIAHRLCHLIWIILHHGVRYEERGPAVCEKSKRLRTVRMIRTLRNLGYRVEPLANPA